MNFLQNQYAQIVLILAGCFVLAFIIKQIVLSFLNKLSQKTETDFDDVLIKILGKPIYIAVILAGVHYSLKILNIVNGYSSFVNKIFFVIYILLGTYVAVRIVVDLIDRWFKKKKDFAKAPRLISNIVNVVLYAIAGIMILSYFDVEISPLIATLGIGGLAVGLALQNTLANLFSGLHIISDEPVKVGDYVEIGTEVAGTVIDIGWRSTRIRTLGQDIIVIPNSTVSDSIIKNLTQKDETVTASVVCGVSYESNLQKVEQTVMQVAKKLQTNSEAAVNDYRPSMRFTDFGESNINFVVYMRAKQRGDKMFLEHEFIKELKAEFDKQKIEISYPVVKVVK